MTDEFPAPAVSSIGFEATLADSSEAASPPASDQSQGQDRLAPEAVDAIFQNETAAPAEAENAEVPLWAWAGIIGLPLEKKRDSEQQAPSQGKKRQGGSAPAP